MRVPPPAIARRCRTSWFSDDDGRKQGGKEIAERTSEFQMVNNFQKGAQILLGPTKLLFIIYLNHLYYNFCSQLKELLGLPRILSCNRNMWSVAVHCKHPEALTIRHRCGFLWDYLFPMGFRSLGRTFREISCQPIAIPFGTEVAIAFGTDPFT